MQSIGGLFAAASLFAFAGAAVLAEPPGEGWSLVFQDDFKGGDKALDQVWDFQNGPSGHILCSRWRENATVEDGVLKLLAKKERKGGQEWTAASMWTKRQFKYGYFECRYRYAAASGTNNSFWIMTREGKDAPGQFEIDINEGHYPCEVAMNLHNWSGEHWAKGAKWLSHGGKMADGAGEKEFTFIPEKPFLASAVRMSSNAYGLLRVVELKAFKPSSDGYPKAFPNALEAQPEAVNIAPLAKASGSKALKPEYKPEYAIDGIVSNESRWVSDYDGNPNFLALDWGKPVEIGALQLVSGWEEDGVWRDAARDFRFEAFDGKEWRTVYKTSESSVELSADLNLGKSFHTYALDWSERELIYYFDGKEIRRIPNGICHKEAPVWLSLAIIKWAGRVTDEIDGKSMDVDYVKVWQRK